MKKVLTIGLVCIMLLFGAIVCANVSNFTFGWQQSAVDLPNLQEWRIYKTETAGTGYTQMIAIAYDGTQKQEYTGSTTIDQPINTKKTYYFIVRAVGKNGLESGNSNEVSAVIDWTTPNVPILFRVTINGQ